MATNHKEELFDLSLCVSSSFAWLSVSLMRMCEWVGRVCMNESVWLCLRVGESCLICMAISDLLHYFQELMFICNRLRPYQRQRVILGNARDLALPLLKLLLRHRDPQIQRRQKQVTPFVSSTPAATKSAHCVIVLQCSVCKAKKANQSCDYQRCR